MLYIGWVVMVANQVVMTPYKKIVVFFQEINSIGKRIILRE